MAFVSMQIYIDLLLIAVLRFYWLLSVYYACVYFMHAFFWAIHQSAILLVGSPEAKDAEEERPPSYPLDRYSIGTNEETKNNLDSQTMQKVPTPTKPISPLMVAKPRQVIPTKKKELPDLSQVSSESSSDEDHDESQFSESKNRSAWGPWGMITACIIEQPIM